MFFDKTEVNVWSLHQWIHLRNNLQKNVTPHPKHYLLDFTHQ